MVTVTIPEDIPWSEEELKGMDPKTAGRVGTNLTFARFIGIFLYNFRGTLDAVQACQRFMEAVNGIPPGTALEVDTDTHGKVNAILTQMTFHTAFWDKLMPHVKAITDAE
jgi:hypothetical protein